MIADFARVIRASFGWVKEVSLDTASAYRAFLKKAVVPSIVLAVAGGGAMILATNYEVVGLNAIGILLIGAVFLFWIIAAQPVVEAASVLGDMAPSVKRIHDRVFITLSVIVVLTLTTIALPPGAAGIKGLAIQLVFILAAIMLGVSLTRRVLAVKVIFLGLLMIASATLPRTIASIADGIAKTDIKIAGALSGNREIIVTLDAIDGRDPVASRPFVNGAPNWHCRTDETVIARLKCYQYPGYDDFTNQQLTPISPEALAIARKRLLAAERAAAEEARRRHHEEQAQEAARAKRIANAAREAELAAAKAADAAWLRFESRKREPPESYSARAQWRTLLSGQQIRITYTNRRTEDAIEVARRLHDIGSQVEHKRVELASEQYFNRMTYPFRAFEAADATRAAVIEVVHLDLQSFADGPNQLTIELN